MSLLVLLVLLAVIVASGFKFNFAFALTLAVAFSGLIALVDLIWFRSKRINAGVKDSILIEYCRSFFPVLLLVWVIRSFIIQPYRVPTGSLEPTIKPGEFIAVSQFAYGLKFPIGNFKLVPVGEPKRGDIVLFYPNTTKTIYVKRLVGLPGDKIDYHNKILTINGKVQPQKLIGHGFDYGDGPGQTQPVDIYQETLGGVVHKIFRRPYSTDGQFPLESDLQGDFTFIVPKGYYFMMGDNRDNSGDSRYFGAIPERYIIGKGLGIFLSWDPVHHHFRWKRVGTSLLSHYETQANKQVK
jgi:signal peptidase I